MRTHPLVSHLLLKNYLEVSEKHKNGFLIVFYLINPIVLILSFKILERAGDGSTVERIDEIMPVMKKIRYWKPSKVDFDREFY